MNPIRWTEKQSLIYLFPLIISISFAMDVFVPAIPVMSVFFQTNDRVMQASLYLFMLTVALGELFAGPTADRIGRRRVTVYSAILFFIGSGLSAFSSTLSQSCAVVSFCCCIDSGAFWSLIFNRRMIFSTFLSG